jgi:hypothetical protein
MLHVYGFNKVGVAVGDLYFVDPDPDPGQEGAEHGVRLEVRLLESPPVEGTIYAARPILVGRPLWRADLLESVDGVPGSFDRTHHHPRMRGWEPFSRQFDRAMTADPIAFVGEWLSDLEALLEAAGLDSSAFGETDAAALRAAVPEILETVRRLLDAVRHGDLARPPAGAPGEGARVGWL